MLRNAQVQQYVQELREAASKDAKVTVADLISWLASLAQGAEKERDRISAIKLLGDHLGAWEPVKQTGGGLSDALRILRERRGTKRDGGDGGAPG